jgi:protein TonB
MKTKKTEKASLENKRLLFIEIGCIVALAAVYFGFEYKTTRTQTVMLEDTAEAFIIEDNVPITQEMPPPPPKMPVIALSDVIDIVDDEIIIEDDLFLEEEDFSLAVEIREYVEIIEDEIEEEPIPFALVEEKPKFNGKDANEFSKWVNQRLVYPEIAKENGVQGRITMMFTVKTDGTVADVRVARGVDPALDREAIRVISSSPKWTPGKQRDRAVPVTYTFPVIFRLR